MKINIKKNRNDILNLAKKNLIPNGWNKNLVNLIAKEKKFSKSQIISLFPEGYKSILEFYISSTDEDMINQCKKLDLIRMKTSDRVCQIIKKRFEINQKEKKIIKKTLLYLTLPQNSKLAANSLYKTVDNIWYIAGDNSTDFNFYTKRAILSVIYTSTIFYWIFRDKDLDQTEKFLKNQLSKLSKVPKIKEKIKLSKEIFEKFSFLRKAN
tara:strand:- start:411 stop:1040 length:630 start_codon:yes stop_codon:yes gene_type:complete